MQAATTTTRRTKTTSEPQNVSMPERHQPVATLDDPKMMVSYRESCLVDSLRANGARQDSKQRRISLERITTKLEKRRQSLPVLPSYLKITHLTNKKSSLKKRGGKKQEKESSDAGDHHHQRKGVSFPLGVLMQQAVAEGDLPGIKHLVSTHGRSAVEEREPNGLPPIMRAIFEGQTASLKFLLDEGADVTALDPERWSALHVAAAMDDMEAAQMVLQVATSKHHQTSMTSLRNVDGERALDMAESLDMASLLLHTDLANNPRMAPPLPPSPSASRRLQEEEEEEEDSMSSEAEVLQLVTVHFEKHSNCKALDEVLRQNTCYGGLLHLAACKNFPHLIGYLCQRSLCPLEARDKNGWTPLHAAAYYNNLDAAMLLVEHGASVHALTHSFEKAADLADHQLIQTLLEDHHTFLNSI